MADDSKQLRFNITKADWDDNASGFKVAALSLPEVKLEKVQLQGNEVLSRHFKTELDEPVPLIRFLTEELKKSAKEEGFSVRVSVKVKAKPSPVPWHRHPLLTALVPPLVTGFGGCIGGGYFCSNTPPTTASASSAAVSGSGSSSSSSSSSSSLSSTASSSNTSSSGAGAAKYILSGSCTLAKPNAASSEGTCGNLAITVSQGMNGAAQAVCATELTDDGCKVLARIKSPDCKATATGFDILKAGEPKAEVVRKDGCGRHPLTCKLVRAKTGG